MCFYAFAYSSIHGNSKKNTNKLNETKRMMTYSYH